MQEALTNARRHAPGAAVNVELHYFDDRLQLLIRDNGPGPPPPGRRAGRARAGRTGTARTGATGCSACASGPRPSAVSCSTGEAVGGGFLVSASLPGKGESA